MKFFNLFWLCLFLITGCSSTNSQLVQGHLVSGKDPKKGVISKSRVGDSIFVHSHYYVVEKPPRMVLVTPVRMRFNLQRVNAPADSILLKTDMDGYCSQNNLLIGLIVGPYEAVCFKDTNQDGSFDRIGTVYGLLDIWKDLDDPVPYQSKAASTVVVGTEGYKKELIYQGIDGATLWVKYREYTGSFDRPTFSQDLAFPVRDGKSEIVFRNLKIEVVALTPSTITYVVVSDDL